MIVKAPLTYLTKGDLTFKSLLPENLVGLSKVLLDSTIAALLQTNGGSPLKFLNDSAKPVFGVMAILTTLDFPCSPVSKSKRTHLAPSGHDLPSDSTLCFIP